MMKYRKILFGKRGLIMNKYRMNKKVRSFYRVYVTYEEELALALIALSLALLIIIILLIQ